MARNNCDCSAFSRSNAGQVCRGSGIVPVFAAELNFGAFSEERSKLDVCFSGFH